MQLKEIVAGYLDRFPETPSLTLAKKIYAENVEVFLSVESARSAIRHLRGQCGRDHRKHVSTQEYITPPGNFCPFETLPEGLKYLDEWEPFTVYGVKKPLILADLHIPYHDRTALVTALTHGLNEGADAIVFLGDLLDFFSLSFWEKDPRKRNFKRERDIYRRVMETIRAHFPDKRMILKIGNHEERYLRYMQVKAPELLDLEEFDIDSIVCAKEFALEVVGDKRILKIGHLNLIHGHEFGRSIFSPVNPARGLYMRGKATAIAAHNHQTSEHTEPDMDGKVTACWSLGCLCDLRPEYMPINRWNYGFGIVDVRGDGNFVVHNHRIIDGSVY